MLDALGGAVGVTVTVRTCPVIVSRDIIGVGVHVELVEADEDVTVLGDVADVVPALEVLVVEVVFCLKGLASQLCRKLF